MSANSYEMRRSFVFKDGKLEFCLRRNVSNRKWLMEEKGMSEEEMANTVHGAYYPGRAYFYKGITDTTTDEEVEGVAELCKQYFNENTEICCGAIPGEEGQLWEPIKVIGMGTGDSRDVN